MYKEDENCWECQQKKFKKGGAKGSDKKWIQKAVKGMRKDKPCTGGKFGGPTCPPGSKQYNLAKVFREMAAKKKKQMGGQTAPMNGAKDIGANNIKYLTSSLQENAMNVMQDQMINNAAQQQMMMPSYDDGGNIFGQTSYADTDPNAMYYKQALMQPKPQFDFYGWANKLDENFLKAQEYNREVGPGSKSIQTTKFNRKQLRKDIASEDPIISNQAKEFKKGMQDIMKQNRRAGTKIFFDKLNPFTPDPTDPRSPNNQFQKQNGGIINTNDMNYNRYYGVPMYNQGGMNNYVYQGQDTGMTAEEFYQYQLETEGPFILPDGTDTGMSRAQFVDMQSQQMQQMVHGGQHTFNPYYTDEEYNKLPTSLKQMADDRLKQELQTNAYNERRGINTAAHPTAQEWYQNLDEDKRPDISFTPQQNIALASQNQLPGQQDNIGYLNMIANQNPAMAKSMFPGIEKDAAGNWFYPAQGTTPTSTATEDVTETPVTKTDDKQKSTATKTTDATGTQDIEDTEALLRGDGDDAATTTTGDATTTDGTTTDGTGDGADASAAGATTKQSDIYTPSNQIGYAGVPVLQGNYLAPGFRMKNRYMPGGYGLAPVAYNAAETVLRKYRNKGRSGGLMGALFGDRMSTVMKFDHRMGKAVPMTPAEQQQVEQQEQQPMVTDDGVAMDPTQVVADQEITDDVGPSAITADNLTYNPNTETYTVDDLVQEQNNPNTTGNNRNVITGKSNRVTLPPNTNPTSKLGQEPNIPVDPAMLDKIQNDPAYGLDALPAVTVTADRPSMTSAEEDARVQDQINMAENKGYYVQGGSIKRYNMGGDMELSALHEEMKALDARKNQLQAMLANVQFNRGQGQLPTSMNQMPMARNGMEVNNLFMNNDNATGSDPGVSNWLQTKQKNVEKTRGALDPATGVQMGMDAAYALFKGTEQAMEDKKNKERIAKGTVMAGFNPVGEDRGSYGMNDRMFRAEDQEYPVQFGTYTQYGGPINTYAGGGSFNNPGFNALPDTVQMKIMKNSKMNYGGAYMDYQEGGEYYLSEDEINQFLQAGGQIEIME
jgi:hypothetical protein